MASSSKKQNPSQNNTSGTVIASLILAGVGWAGVYYMVNSVLPGAGARWAFFVLLYFAVAGSAVPLLRYLNHQLRGKRPPPPDWVALRQGLWVGLFVATCAWLQIPRVLNGGIAFFLGLALIVIEIFLRLRERNLHGY